MVVNRFGQMVHLSPVTVSIIMKEMAKRFIKIFLKHDGVPASISHNRDSIFTAALWSRQLKNLGTRLLMSTDTFPKQTAR